ncbi:hypothetical protein AGMMS50255_8010 [Spirochaetia bacterium]|nr:hypothetical protein AGMMS50255_8010 [Spirochaetia bacterium]
MKKLRFFGLPVIAALAAMLAAGLTFTGCDTGGGSGGGGNDVDLALFEEAVFRSTVSNFRVKEESNKEGNLATLTAAGHLVIQPGFLSAAPLDEDYDVGKVELESLGSYDVGGGYASGLLAIIKGETTIGYISWTTNDGKLDSLTSIYLGKQTVDIMRATFITTSLDKMELDEIPAITWDGVKGIGRLEEQ